MKLVSCYIENYGTLSGKTVDFREDLTEFCLGNGVGKTTLASFVKAMFFGLETRRERAKEFVDREHFCPFGGGRFGGNITFDYGGKRYRIERFFDEKSDVRDQCKVYCNDVLCEDFGENIGEKVFELDKKSFEKVLFVNSSDVEISSTGNINAKLNNVLEGFSENGADFERAVAILQKRQGDLYKQRGACRISSVKDSLKEKRARLANLQKIRDTLPQKSKMLSQTEKEIAEMNTQILSAQKQNVLCDNWQTYDAICHEHEEYENQSRHLREQFPLGWCDDKELENAERLLKEIDVLKGRMDQKTFTADDEENLSALQDEFRLGVPSEEELKIQQENVKKLSALSSRIEAFNDTKFSAGEQALRQRFAACPPSQDDTEKLRELSDRLSQTEQALRARETVSDVAATKKSSNVPSKTALLIVAVVGVLLAVAGGICIVLSQVGLGAAMCAAGVVLALAGGILYFRNSRQKIGQNSSETAELSAQRQTLIAEIGAIVEKYGYSVDNGAVFAVQSFQRDLQDFSALQQRELDYRDKIKKTDAQIASVRSELREFFARFGFVGDDFFPILSDLRADISSFADLTRRRNDFQSNQADLRDRLSAKTDELAEFCRKYSLSSPCEEEIKRFGNACSQNKSLNDKIAATRARAEQFKIEKSLFERPVSEKIDLQLLNVQKDSAIDRKISLSNEIESCELEAEKIDELEAEIVRESEQLAQYQKSFDLLKKTEELLTLAENNLKEKYIRPIRDRFADYTNLLESTFGKKITVTPDLKISFEQNGASHDDRFLSAGQKSLCALCFRLALLDNIYPDEKPFLVLDDPFVHLDAEHFAKCRDLLNKISQKFQIIYFTCHSSRKVADL